MLTLRHSATQTLRSLRTTSSLNFSALTSSSFEIKKVGVVGLGLMGHGIVQTVASSGYEVVAVDLKPSVVATAMNKIETSLDKLSSRQIKKNLITPEDAKIKNKEIIGRIEATTKMTQLRDCDLVIEAIVENMMIKEQFYAELHAITKQKTIFASNTSSFSIIQLAEFARRQHQVVGLHFFNPVQMMQLVEIAQTPLTDSEVVAACHTFVTSLNKTPVHCKDTPGFIVNRLLVPYIAQSIQLYANGVASKEDIDTSMKLGAGHPMGPLTLADYIGLDTILSILEGWVHTYPNDPSFFVPDLLTKYVKAGNLGRKSGQGFFTWEGDQRK